MNVGKLLDNGAHAGCRNLMMAVILTDLMATCARTLRRVRVASALLRQCRGKVYHGGQVDLSTSDRPEDAEDWARRYSCSVDTMSRLFVLVAEVV